MTIELIPFILAIIGLLAGALGTWYMRRKLRGPRIVLGDKAPDDTPG